MVKKKEKKSKKVVYQKDEFGRDIVVDKSDRKHKKESKKKKKKHKRDRDSRSRSLSPQGRLSGTPPPADPFRPQVITIPRASAFLLFHGSDAMNDPVT